MRLAIDLDNVMVGTTTAVLDYINERVPVNLKMEDIYDYYIENALPAQYKWIASAAFTDSLMWKKVKVIPEAVEYLHKLYDEGYEIYFVTSSLPSNLHKKIKHLERNLDFFPKAIVLFLAISPFGLVKLLACSGLCVCINFFTVL